MLHSINHEQRLYVLKHSAGFTTLGFEYAEQRRRAVLEWIGVDVPPVRVGTAAAYAAYEAAMKAGAAHNEHTGARCEAELTPALRGLEGRRVEVTTPGGERRRFWVGRSTGWMPCHLEIARRNCMGGPAAYVPDGARVVVVR